jgi:hypothetical protein
MKPPQLCKTHLRDARLQSDNLPGCKKLCLEKITKNTLGLIAIAGSFALNKKNPVKMKSLKQIKVAYGLVYFRVVSVKR